jgi:hypothetical protein
MSSFTKDLDFWSGAGREGAQVWLNPQLYRIHKRYEFHTIGKTDEPDASDTAITMQNRSGGMNRHGFKLSYGGRHLKATGRTEEIGTVTYDEITPESKYFFLFFSDNSVLDLENPLVSVSSTVATRMF